MWPLVLARVPGAKLLVTGDDPPREVLRFACDSIEFLGRVPDLERFYDALRVAIVPIRYGSGVKLKTVEALQFGVPTVSTTIGAESIPSDVDGLLPVAIGAAAGITLAFGSARVVSSLLFQVSPYDPAVSAGAVGILLAVGTTACLLPARRAAAVEPMQALRTE